MVAKGKAIKIDLKQVPERFIRGAAVGVALLSAIVILVAGGDGSYSRQIPELEDRIATSTQKLQALNAMQTMAGVEENWVRLRILADRYGVELLPLEENVDPPYTGAAGSWHWILRGQLKDIAVVLKEGESYIPMVLGEMAYQSGLATMSVSVLGELGRNQ